ncbi:thiamine pyrophosphate-dependent enzyme [Streptomyces sp. NPDC102360]|uniref:alpha-ketoacid dehydrogenase subunit alpha/beta n=1 Tax=Streptomyces sp. NPDC102360 TaxID=3366160 RepID=UPI00381FA888
MTTHRELTPGAGWTEVRSTLKDWDAAAPEFLVNAYSQLVLIRAFEQYVLDLSAAGNLHGPAHSSIGQEGAAVGSVLALRSTDTVSGSHRGHHQFLAKALGHLAPDLDLADPLEPAVRDMLLRTLSEITGLKTGWSSGRGGSMHLRWLDAGATGTNAIVGGGVPIAAGYAWAHKAADRGDIAVTYFGDGAVNIGSTLESFNLAAAWKLPLCFFIENNLYAVSTHVSEVTGEPRLSARGPGFGIRSWKVDGQDVLAVHAAMTEAAEHMRAGGGPTLIEADTYRYLHQNGAFPGSAFGYRDKDEEARWRELDPIDQVAAHLTRRGIRSADEVEAMARDAADLMAAIGEEILEADPEGKAGRKRIRPELWPDPEFADVGVRGDLSEFGDAAFCELGDYDGEIKDEKFVRAVAAVMDRRMETDDSIVVLGEDVHRLNGGTNGATRGLSDRFPGRVLGTPIAENAFTGLACGMALDGRYKPVVELMYADFMWVAADQLFNQIGKARHMYGGTRGVPLVLRSKVAIGAGYGSQHSMDPAGVMATNPGWRIVAPSTPFEYVGLMNAALKCEDPVLVLEHVDLYNSTGPSPVGDLDYCLPLGRAAVKRSGTGATVLTYLGMVAPALAAAEAVPDADAEVIDLRWLDRASVDWDTIGESVRRTNRVITAEQGPPGTAYGSWLADEIHRRFFDHLDAPVQRVTGREASPSISKKLEQAAIAGQSEMETALRQIGEV